MFNLSLMRRRVEAALLGAPLRQEDAAGKSRRLEALRLSRQENANGKSLRFQRGRLKEGELERRATDPKRRTVKEWVPGSDPKRHK
jgi:hypothetical protein